MYKSGIFSSYWWKKNFYLFLNFSSKLCCAIVTYFDAMFIKPLYTEIQFLHVCLRAVFNMFNELSLAIGQKKKLHLREFTRILIVHTFFPNNVQHIDPYVHII